MKEFQLQQPFLIKNTNLNLYFNWRVTGYVFIFALIALPVSFLTTINYRSEIFSLVIRLIQVNNFIFLGMLHAELLGKRIQFSHYSVKEKFYFSFVLSLVIYFTLRLFYFITNSNMGDMAMVSSCAFILPYMLVQTWNYYYQLLPANKSMIWNGYKRTLDAADVAHLNSLMIQFRLSKKFESEEESNFLANIPLNIELGKLFNAFLNFENNGDVTQIECVTQSNKIYGWKFYVLSFGGFYQKILDPEKSLQNNGSVKRNATILAKRVEVS